jgi:DNA-binding NtrC family response regulator
MSGKPAALKLSLVAIDDDPAILGLIRDGLDSIHLEIFTATDPSRGMDLVREKRPQIVLLDLKLPGVTGLELLEQVLEIDPRTNVILLTGHYSPESAVEAIRKGAYDYLTKPDFLEKLRQRITNLLEDARRLQWGLELADELLENFQFEGIVGSSPLMLATFHKMRRIAPHFRTVLVTGQTGTGKELVGAALHRMSPAASRPFVVCNTAALVESLIESELFGHVRGAFTGATQDKAGLFEHANGGTLFLDEIGEMSQSAQAKMLRVLQSQEIQRVGSPEVRKLDVRVIAATNRDLRAMVTARQFREDLYYRLAMVEIDLPTLCERKEDLPLLTRHFLKRFSQQYGKPLLGLAPRVEALFARYQWPGNIRELENILGYACMMAQGAQIDMSDLPEKFWSLRPEDMLEGKDLMPLDVIERRYARHVLESMGGKRIRAAAALGISRTKLYRLLKEEKPARREQESSKAPATGRN